ncbi:MAG: ImmA/IrrE family metallo-endopeptidase [Alphaproteobacteria bacterium]|nr:ImmA/IrrE family metallo-endopeptidase [Alphaproteobacteria bacterium]
MFNPARVELVRLRLGLTKIGFAERLGVDRKALQRHSTGQANLPVECRERLLQISGYPEAFFFKISPEYPNPDSVSFRSLRSLTAASRNAAISAGALAFELDDWISERYELPVHTLPSERATASDPVAVAVQLRSVWGIGMRPVGNMVNLLEAHGVRVFSLVEGTRHLDAYSLWRNDKPYVFLNTLKTAERSRFDAAHELGHLLLHRHTGSKHPRAEAEADAFAAAFLMPEEDLRAEFQWIRGLEEIIEKKRRWGVSAAALAYTLHKLGKISDWHYRGYCIELGKLGRQTEPNSMPHETSQIWAKILTDLWRQRITMFRLAEYLAIPEQELQDLLFGIVVAVNESNVSSPLRVVE